MKRKTKSEKEVSKYDILIITGASSGIGEGFANFAVNAMKSDAKIINISRTPTKINSNFNSCPRDSNLKVYFIN